MVLKIPPRKVATPAIAKPKPSLAPSGKVGVPRPAVLTTRKLQGPATQVEMAPAGSGFATARALNEQREANANKAFEFHMKVGEGGINGVTIILTDTVRAPAMPYFCYMHRWGFEQGESKTEVCLTDGADGCPLCRHLGRKGNYEMMLSCIDTRPYTPKNGPNANKVIPRQRRPYPVKMGMIPVFERLYTTHKTFRGMVLRLHRDKKTSPATGSQVELIRTLTEAELKKYADLSKPFDMTVQYPRLTPEKMGLLHNIDVDASSGAVGGADAPGGIVGDDSLPF